MCLAHWRSTATAPCCMVVDIVNNAVVAVETTSGDYALLSRRLHRLDQRGVLPHRSALPGRHGAVLSGRRRHAGRLAGPVNTPPLPSVPGVPSPTTGVLTGSVGVTDADGDALTYATQRPAQQGHRQPSDPTAVSPTRRPPLRGTPHPPTEPTRRTRSSSPSPTGAAASSPRRSRSTSHRPTSSPPARPLRAPRARRRAS